MYLHTFVTLYLCTFVPLYLFTYVPFYLCIFLPLELVSAFMCTFFNLCRVIPFNFCLFVPLYLCTFVLCTCVPVYLCTFFLLSLSKECTEQTQARGSPMFSCYTLHWTKSPIVLTISTNTADTRLYKMQEG